MGMGMPADADETRIFAGWTDEDGFLLAGSLDV